MKLSKFVLGLTLISALCFAGCSDGSSGGSSSGGSNSDGNRGTLDLRIQNNGTIAGSARFIEKEAGSSNLYEASTNLVSAVSMEDGIHFTIKNPLLALKDENFKKGSSFIDVTRIEKINGQDIFTTKASITNHPFHNWGNESEPESDNEEVSFVYPLCEAGEIYTFRIQIAPLIDNSDPDIVYSHYMTVKAKGGIGDIDYSNFSYGDWAFASYSDGKANIWTENVIPPQDTVVENVRTSINIFYGDNKWNGNTRWLMGYESKEDVEEVVSDIELRQEYGDEEGNTKTLKELGAKTFFAQYFYTFSVPNTPQVTHWCTATLDTDLVEVD